MRPLPLLAPVRALARGLAPVLAVVLAGLVGAAGPGVLTPTARAEVVVHRDARHDVRLTHEGRPGSRAAPRRREPDITRIRVSYNERRLRVLVRLRHLGETRNHAALVQIRTPHHTAGVYVTRIPRRDLLSVSLIRGFGRVVECPGLQYRMFFPKAIVKVLVPRSCLDDAPWVRAGFAMSWTTSRRALSDDALRRGLSSGVGLTRRLQAGPPR